MDDSRLVVVLATVLFMVLLFGAAFVFGAQEGGDEGYLLTRAEAWTRLDVEGVEWPSRQNPSYANTASRPLSWSSSLGCPACGSGSR